MGCLRTVPWFSVPWGAEPLGPPVRYSLAPLGGSELGGERRGVEAGCGWRGGCLGVERRREGVGNSIGSPFLLLLIVVLVVLVVLVVFVFWISLSLLAFDGGLCFWWEKRERHSYWSTKVTIRRRRRRLILGCTQTKKQTVFVIVVVIIPSVNLTGLAKVFLLGIKDKTKRSV